MRTGFLGLLATLVAGAGVTLAQAPPPALPAPPPGPPVPPPWITNPNLLPAVAPAPAGEPTAGDTKKDESKAATPTPACPPEADVGISIPEGPNAFNADPHALDKKFWIFPVWDGPGKVWVSADYLLWWIRKQPVPGPLVTSGTTSSLGIFGSPGTSVLAGDSEIGYGSLSGGRLTVGVSNDDHTWALQGVGFFLEKGRSNFSASSDANGNPVLARPFINSLTGQETATLVSAPGAFSGNIQVSSTSQLNGAEINLLHPINQTLVGGVDFLIGARYIDLEESLAISQSSNLLAGGVLGFNGTTVFAPGTVSVSDSINTRNQFTGGQVGLQADLRSGRLFVLMVGKLGIGNTHEVINLNGQTTLSGTGAPATTVPGGLLVIAPNSGRAIRDEFTLVPEFTINVGIEVTRNVRIFAGYNFLYWDDVARPGNQVNRIVNPSLVPSSLAFGSDLGGATPSNVGSHSDFWAQGLNCGVVVRY
jgi:hypothetical protein